MESKNHLFCSLSSLAGSSVVLSEQFEDIVAVHYFHPLLKTLCRFKMRSFVPIAFLSAVTGFVAAEYQFEAYKRIARDIFDVEKRQITCSGFGNSCADVCGAGYISCITPSKCYNPGAGQQCCSDSSMHFLQAEESHDS
jgi:hypothetical protein